MNAMQSAFQNHGFVSGLRNANRLIGISKSRFSIVAVVVAIAVGAVSSPVQGCDICGAQSVTLSEQVSLSDMVVLVTWVEATKTSNRDTEPRFSSTVYQLKRVIRGPKGQFKLGTRITLPGYRRGKIGDQFLLFGSQGTVMEWSSPLAVSQKSYKYITNAPLLNLTAAKRLAYFVNYLEDSDLMVSNDAHAEFVNAPFKDIAAVAKLMPREKIRQWFDSADTPATRHSLYGLMLGLCGTEDDAKSMQKKILESTGDFRLGLEGVVAGYLMLTGSKGLDVIDRTKLASPYIVDENGKFVLDKQGEKIDISFSETYSAMQGIRFMWTFGEGRISKDRLRKSMRVLLDRPELADLVIADLARWKDWEIQDRLMKLYGATDYNIPSIKRAIVRFMVASTKDGVPKDSSKAIPEHVTKGNKFVELLRKKDPKTVGQAERLIFLR